MKIPIFPGFHTIKIRWIFQPATLVYRRVMQTIKNSSTIHLGKYAILVHGSDGPLRHNIYSHVAMQQIPPLFCLEKYHQQEMDVFFSQLCMAMCTGYQTNLGTSISSVMYIDWKLHGNYINYIHHPQLNSKFWRKKLAAITTIMVCKNQISQPSPDNPKTRHRHGGDHSK